jgi:hypothetical protein
VVGLYAALVIFGAIDDQSQPQQPPAPGTAAETTIFISVFNVAPATQTLDANVTVVPGAGLVDKAGRLLDDISVTLHPAVQQNPLTFARGGEVGTAPVQLIANGSFQRWPFDEYQTRNLVAEVAVGKTPNDRLVPTRVVVTGAVAEWKITTSASQRPTDLPAATDVILDRDGGTLIFDVLLCAILIALPIGALFVAITTVQGKRPFYASTLGWLAALLFAVVPLRTLFPGAPPLGGWIDRTVVIWVLVGLVVAQGLYVKAWWNER